MAAKAETEFSPHFATASDGAKLSYYSVGTGDNVLILHGAFSYALLHSELAIALSPYYTVHVASRRARGLSGPYPSSVTDLNPHPQPSGGSIDTQESNETLTLGPKTYTRTYNPAFTAAVTETELSDIEAFIEATGAVYIIAISSGALLALQGLLQKSKSPTLSKIRKAIIFEPPIFFTDRPTSCNIGQLPHFERQLEDGDIVGAAVTSMQIVQLGPTWIPGWLMKFLSGMMFRAQDRDVEKKKAGGEEDRGICTMSGLTKLLRYEFAVVEGMVAESGRYEILSCEENDEGGDAGTERTELLLLSGERSPAFLLEGMAVLRETVRGAKSVTIDGVGHELLCNREMRGKPERAVPTIREFFS
jgi:hypothetical protein